MARDSDFDSSTPNAGVLQSHATIIFRDVAVVSIPIVIGGLLYLLVRSKPPIIAEWLYHTQIGNALKIYQIAGVVEVKLLPAWIIYNLPDALWSFSFTYCILALWNFTVKKTNAFWVFCVPLLSIALELGQLSVICTGTFDFADLVFIVIGCSIPFIFINNTTNGVISHA